MKKYVIIALLFPFFTGLYAQDDNLDDTLVSRDTVFILAAKDIKARVNGTNSVQPDKKYPEDMSRVYYLPSDLLAFNTYFTKLDLSVPFYFVESKEKFQQRNVISSTEFAQKSEKDALAIVENKVLMLVDPSFSDSENHYLVRVFRYAGER